MILESSYILEWYLSMMRANYMESRTHKTYEFLMEYITVPMHGIYAVFEDRFSGFFVWNL